MPPNTAADRFQHFQQIKSMTTRKQGNKLNKTILSDYKSMTTKNQGKGTNKNGTKSQSFLIMLF